MTTSVRTKHCLSPFFPPFHIWRAMPVYIQAPCQLGFSAKNCVSLVDCVPGLVEFTTDSWEIPPRGTASGVARYSLRVSGEGIKMLGKIAGAMIGEKVAGRNKGAKGAILGAGVAAIARRGFGPLTAAMAIGWGAKKLWDWRKGRSPRYPTDATPS